MPRSRLSACRAGRIPCARVTGLEPQVQSLVRRRLSNFDQLPGRRVPHVVRRRRTALCDSRATSNATASFLARHRRSHGERQSHRSERGEKPHVRSASCCTCGTRNRLPYFFDAEEIDRRRFRKTTWCPSCKTSAGDRCGGRRSLLHDRADGACQHKPSCLAIGLQADDFSLMPHGDLGSSGDQHCSASVPQAGCLVCLACALHRVYYPLLPLRRFSRMITSPRPQPRVFLLTGPTVDTIAIFSWLPGGYRAGRRTIGRR